MSLHKNVGNASHSHYRQRDDNDGQRDDSTAQRDEFNPQKDTSINGIGNASRHSGHSRNSSLDMRPPYNYGKRKLKLNFLCLFSITFFVLRIPFF